MNVIAVTKIKKFIFFNWDSIHKSGRATTKHGVKRKRGRPRKKAYRKPDKKEPKDDMCLSSLDLKPFRSKVKGRDSASKESQSLAVRGKELLTQTSL